jgi:hypothetical protein
MFGKLLGSVVRLANAPLRAAEDGLAFLCGEDDGEREEDRMVSKPLDFLAKQLEGIDD